VNAVRLHPVYVPEYHKDGTTGGYLRRFSCRVCIFSTDADLRAIYENDRVAFEQVSHLESKLGYTMRPGASLVQIVSAHASTPIEEARQQSFCFRTRHRLPVSTPEQLKSPKPAHSSLLIRERQGQFRAHLTNANRHLVPQKKGIAMPNSSPVASTHPLEAAARINRYQRRLAICLVLTVLNAIVVANLAGPLYRATTRDALQQIGVTLLFAALVGSLTRMWFLTLTSRPR